MAKKRTTLVCFSQAAYRRAHNRTPGGKGVWRFSVRWGALHHSFLLEEAAAMQQAGAKREVRVDLKSFEEAEVRLAVSPACLLRTEAQRSVEQLVKRVTARMRFAGFGVSEVLPVEVCP